MPDIMEILPFLIPVVIIQFGLLGYTLYHIITHKNYNTKELPNSKCQQSQSSEILFQGNIFIIFSFYCASKLLRTIAPSLYLCLFTSQ